MRRAVAALTVAFAAAGAAPAHASLVYVKYATGSGYKPSVWTAADDGSARRRLAAGTDPRISPDGTSVAYATVPQARTGRSALRIVPAAGGASRVVLPRLINSIELDWSPDSRRLLALTGPELGPYRLVVLDAATGAQRTLAKGFFSGASFSPDGTQVVFSRAAKDTYPQHSDLYVAGTDAGDPVRITRDGRSLSPLWGPVFIAFTHATPRKNDAPVYNIWRIAPDGTARAAITRDRVPSLVSGLTPTQFSADGTRLLTQFGGQDTSYAVTVNPSTGKERVIGPKAENGYYATALSKDGSTILVATGGFDPGNRHDVATVPYAGGRPTVLVRNAFLPDWNR